MTANGSADPRFYQTENAAIQNESRRLCPMGTICGYIPTEHAERPFFILCPYRRIIGRDRSKTLSIRCSGQSVRRDDDGYLYERMAALPSDERGTGTATIPKTWNGKGGSG